MKIPGGILWLALTAIASCATTETRPVDAPIKAIMRLEDTRTIGPNGELLQYLSNADAAVRERAATAVGRLRFPNGGEATTAKLRALLRDSNERVRAAATFALGMREDPSAYVDLVELGAGAKRDSSALIRARALEAASKLGRQDLTEEFLTGLDDPSADVRLEAAAGAARWKTDAPSASNVNVRLAAFVVKESDLRARTYGLFALERRKAKEGREVFLKSVFATDVDERLFAVRGLANLAGETEVDEALIVASRDKDWRVAVEALRGLGKSSSRPSLDAIAAAIGSENHHVRAVGLEAATQQYDAFTACGLALTTQGVGNFERIWFDPSIAVRCAAMPNVVRIDPQARLGQEEWPHWNAAYFRELGRGKHWDPLYGYLMFGNKDAQSLLVSGAVVEALGSIQDPQAHEILLKVLSTPDNGLRLAAVTALLEQEKPVVDVMALEQCYDTSRGELSTEVRFNVLKLAAKIGGDDAIKLLERGMSDEDAYVRRTAHDELEKLTKKSISWTDTPLPAVELVFPGEGLLSNIHPHVVISTDRGEMEFVLFADEAPQHVFNFLKHLDFYKGTTFHRVVSDFVAQGGDARGDGNGGSSWRGDALRHEITPRKYIRGSLGMPRNEDWDSGGSQLFITHRMTPHLDGRYTIFGELVKGFDVLDALDLGDKILAVRVLR